MYGSLPPIPVGSRRCGFVRWGPGGLGELRMPRPSAAALWPAFGTGSCLPKPRLQEHSWLVAGDLEIYEVNRELGLQLPESDEHHTLAGFLLERLQHIPAPGESLRWKGHHFQIMAMDGPRIDRVEITRRAPEPSAEADGGGGSAMAHGGDDQA